MNKLFISFFLLSMFTLTACSRQTTEEEQKIIDEEEKVDELIKSDQERIDSFKNANGL